MFLPHGLELEGDIVNVVRNLFVYSAALVLVLVSVPSAVVGWYTVSPATFGTAVHAFVGYLDPVETEAAAMQASIPGGHPAVTELASAD